MMLRSVPWAPITAHIESIYGLKASALGHFSFWRLDDGPIWTTPASFSHPSDLADLQSWGWPVWSALPPEGHATGDLMMMIGADAQQNMVALSADQAATLQSTGALDPAIWADSGHTAPVLAALKGHLALGGVDARTGRFLTSKHFR